MLKETIFDSNINIQTLKKYLPIVSIKLNNFVDIKLIDAYLSSFFRILYSLKNIKQIMLQMYYFIEKKNDIQKFPLVYNVIKFYVNNKSETDSFLEENFVF